MRKPNFNMTLKVLDEKALKHLLGGTDPGDDDPPPKP